MSGKQSASKTRRYTTSRARYGKTVCSLPRGVIAGLASAATPGKFECIGRPPSDSSAICRAGAIFFSLNHLQIFLDGYGTNLVTSDLIFSHHFTQSVLCEGPRRSTRFGFPVVVLPHSTFKPSPAKPYRIRTSENPRLQLLWNPHLPERFLSADSKRLSLAEWCPRPFYNQH